MSMAQRTQALLDLVEEDRRAQCAAILAQAQQQAQALLAHERAQARLAVREVFAQERERALARVAAARANLQTRRRLHAQRQAADWLALGWERLPPALIRRWQDDAARAAWVAAALDRARRVLPPGAWRVLHADGWPPAERQAVQAQLQQEIGAAPVFAQDAALAAGLRITAGGNVVDATLAGLVADRDEIGARLLGALEAVG